LIDLTQINQENPMKNLTDATRTLGDGAATRAPTMPTKVDSQLRRLVVGKGITVQGEITSCDSLIVEGTVKADIAGCKDMQIAKGGLYVGTASVENADIQGRFEGELTVSAHLMLRSTGELAAKVRYQEIEVESGGDLSGDIRKEIAGKPTLVRSA
jgi:cytoskeletal protein CcmA (bactofilin family)